MPVPPYPQKSSIGIVWSTAFEPEQLYQKNNNCAIILLPNQIKSVTMNVTRRQCRMDGNEWKEEFAMNMTTALLMLGGFVLLAVIIVVAVVAVTVAGAFNTIKDEDEI